MLPTTWQTATPLRGLTNGKLNIYYNKKYEVTIYTIPVNKQTVIVTLKAVESNTQESMNSKGMISAMIKKIAKNKCMNNRTQCN